MKPSGNYRQLQRIIAGLTEGIILIHRNKKIEWANKAALAMHGARRIKDLGSTPSGYRQHYKLEYRNNRPIESEKYPLDRTVAGESFGDLTVRMRRAGRPARPCYLVFRSLPVSGDSGDLDYHVLIVRDETERFEAEERFESAFNANPAPAIICRSSDRRYIKVNPGFLEMTGFARRDVIGVSLGKLDVLNEADKRELALDRFNKHQTIPQMEASLPLPDGNFKAVIVAGEPLEIADEKCMLFTFADLDPRKKAEAALRHSEERFATSFRLSPVPAMIWKLAEFTLTDVNEAFKRMSGYTEEELLGRRGTELQLWSDRSAGQRLESAIKASRSVRNVDLQLRAKDGSLIDCLAFADAVIINEGESVLCVLQDVTAQKRSEAELITAIETVMADTSWFSRAIVEKLAGLRRTPRSEVPSGAIEDLTTRERQVLALICQGESDKEMSATLKLSPNTIRNHISSLYHKIGVKRRAAAVIWARERGITGRDAIWPRRKIGR
ncbi:MAG: helix-turn-helix transcriptional regulator [Hyphomicrobiales bacterium]|nr:helix-turn-helix transcriptional regulator [Hyphomicrobiales bacterium]MBV9518580.1 helix-turn-helix transcriptional regulator [Hyphomicrobiales bacterium]